ncbi:MAG: hypothetical protein K2H64_00280 [Desulfovibrio sp.]|nr:hypothetical protein [Desulfovibrio sp.]
MKKIACLLVLALLLGACVKQKMTFEQQQLNDASQQCRQEATSMNPENPTFMNSLWSSYYEMCMSNFGFTEEQINSTIY